jgi:hypothetical protein
VLAARCPTGKSPKSCQPLYSKIFRFTRILIYVMSSPSTPLRDDAHRHVFVGAGCDGRCGVRRGLCPPGETLRRTVKSCGPGAATLASIRPARAGPATGARKAVPRGRVRISRQTSRGEGRDVSAVPVVFCPCASARGMPVCSRARDLRAQSALRLSFQERSNEFAKPGHIAARERGRMPDAASHRLTGASPRATPSRLRLRGGENRAAGIGASPATLARC